MLQRLEIQNIAIIDRVEIELGEGLNVLTGETGAGKSIIIDSINAILGERMSKELIRTGRDKAVVEAVFNVNTDRLSDLFERFGIEGEEDGSLIISREFSASGKNICRINGRIATVSMLKELGERLIDIHGQHDNQSLLRTESHIELLDSFAESKISSLKEEYLKHLESYREIKNKLKKLSGDAGERERKIDILRFQIDEIKKARLKVGEEEEIEKQRNILLNSERIISTLSNAYEALGSGGKLDISALDKINKSVSDFCNIEDYDEKYSALKKRLEAVSYELEDIVSEIRDLRDSIEFEPSVLEELEERLDVLYRLKKKYGDSIEGILEYQENAKKELDEIVNNEEIINKLKDDLEKEDEELYKLAKKINGERIKTAELLESRIGSELQDLEMKNTRFKVNIEFDDSVNDGERKYNNNGLDRVEFLISTNAGEPLKPLSKIASGGEMSRIMLAIKTILANVDKMPTMIFDEIDIGISGIAAQKVGEKLCFISKNHQVISVTHLAQIACMADNNYYIEKVTKDGNTETIVKSLNEEDKRNEIARIIGGAKISDIALKHAEEMLDYAKEFKKAKSNG
ncbi:MAG TPA: DNA repair protein RecN [Acetivibrio sp.]|jgi:DNA repair protein RecN (Recombination protein N)|nr:DNA repair protein RecN [Clostridium sp.]HOQ38320.1 DNA repair protein RecN [Acetivibrio sp.]HPT90327.1 DNA repair protein RecN [Acetivibrio sp.]